MPAMTLEELREFLRREFPQNPCDVEAIGPLRATLRLPYHEGQLRPGGTISGPTIMAAADAAMYAALLAEIGPVALAVTTSFTVNFLRRPPPADLLAEARILKLGRRLAVGEIAVASSDGGDLVAHAVATYSIPPREGQGEPGHFTRG